MQTSEEFRGVADPPAGHAGREDLAALFTQMYQLGKPTIARVQGYALAGGFGLALACDFVVASEQAVFGAPEVNVGLWPYMITIPLVRSMRPKDALDLILTARRVSASEGRELGFVSPAGHRCRARLHGPRTRQPPRDPLPRGYPARPPGVLPRARPGIDAGAPRIAGHPLDRDVDPRRGRGSRRFRGEARSRLADLTGGRGPATRTARVGRRHDTSATSAG